MPVARKNGQRIRSGLVAAAAVTSAYEVRQMAIQSDQGLAFNWSVNGQESKPPMPARITTNADKSRSPDGFYECDWLASYFTFGMFGYWLSTLLPGGVDSADVTIMTYTDEDVAIYLQCLINRPRPGDDMTAVAGGWGEIRWRFTRGVIIT